MVDSVKGVGACWLVRSKTSLYGEPPEVTLRSDGRVCGSAGFVALLPGVFPQSRGLEAENQYEEVRPPPTMEVPPTPVLMVTAPDFDYLFAAAEARMREADHILEVRPEKPTAH